MRYAIAICPECGGELWGEADMVPACSVVTKLPDGSYEFSGHQEIFDNGTLNSVVMNNEEVSDETVRVQCQSGHEWLTRRYDEFGEMQDWRTDEEIEAEVEA